VRTHSKSKAAARMDLLRSARRAGAKRRPHGKVRA
jgi:hypothetical protein